MINSMKKILAVLSACTVLAALAGAVPEVVESAVPASETVPVMTRSYNESVSGSGSLAYIGQRDITSALPLVLKRFCVGEGDIVAVGDTVAVVDKEGTASLIESLGQVSQLAVAAANLSTAVALIPEKVTADCSGRVISTAADGAAVESGYSIATVAPSDSLVISAAVSENDIARVCEGQSVVFRCAAYPDEIFTGKVSRIASAARSQYNGAVLETVVDIQVKPDEEDERLKSGLSADIEVQLSDPHMICVVPYNAIGQDDAGEFVYVYEDGKAVRREIFTGAEFSDGTEVIKGVSAGEELFYSPEEIEGRSFIRSGDKNVGSN